MGHCPAPVQEKRKRGRPRKNPLPPVKISDKPPLPSTPSPVCRELRPRRKKPEARVVTRRGLRLLRRREETPELVVLRGPRSGRRRRTYFGDAFLFAFPEVKRKPEAEEAEGERGGVYVYPKRIRIRVEVGRDDTESSGDEFEESSDGRRFWVKEIRVPPLPTAAACIAPAEQGPGSRQEAGERDGRREEGGLGAAPSICASPTEEADVLFNIPGPIPDLRGLYNFRPDSRFFDDIRIL